MPSSFLAAHLAAILSLTAPASVPDAPVADAPETSAAVEPKSESLDPREPTPAVPEPALEDAPPPSEPVVDEPGLVPEGVQDPDAPVLQPRPSRSPSSAAFDEATRLRTLRVGTAAGLLLGVGTTLGLVAPLFMLRPTRPFVLDAETSIGIGTNAAPLAAGMVVGVVGGAMTVFGATLYSDLVVEPASAAPRQRSLHIASGIAFGLASGLFVAAAIDGVRAGAQWQKVLNRPASPEDVVDGEQVALKASRAVALLSAVPALLGIGIGLRLGDGAQARVVPMGSGVAVAGRF